MFTDWLIWLDYLEENNCNTSFLRLVTPIILNNFLVNSFPNKISLNICIYNHMQKMPNCGSSYNYSDINDTSKKTGNGYGFGDYNGFGNESSMWFDEAH